jgi:hypothetical protein
MKPYMILTVCYDRDGRYQRLLNVFERSARAVMPNVGIEVLDEDGSEQNKPKAHAHKLNTAVAFIDAANWAVASGLRVAVCDVDLMFLRSIDSVWKREFDVAVTVRSGGARYNTGIWFMRPNKRARAFVEEWARITKVLSDTYPDRAEEIGKDGGIDQHGLRLAIKGNAGARIVELPCHEWNATQSEWDKINRITRVVHIKSMLRRAVLGDVEEGMVVTPYVAKLAKIWKRWEG